MIVEVCANSLQSALNAQKGGADRIELCSELAVGGITPSYGMLQMVRDAISIPVHVLIRPRSGHFTYSEAEFELMCRDVASCARLGFEGVVCGLLNEDFHIDLERLKALLAHKGSMHFTFHRAFDWVAEPLQALAQLEGLGVDTLLSSGQALTAEAGLPLLETLNSRAGALTVMPGAGIGPENAPKFKEKGFKAIHLSGASLGPAMPNPAPLPMSSPSMLSDNALLLSSEALIRSVVKSVK